MSSKSKLTTTAQPGKVYLVGAGPGDPGLLTVRAMELLTAADVVLYDRLVGSEILDYARQDAKLVFVGKRPGRPGKHRQRRIERLLVRYARAGKIVVRLKGGDPYVFGRGGEEALALTSSDVQFEIVPGVSAAYAVPAAAGIPITHRGLSTAFGVFTGQEADGNESSGIPWSAAAELPTAVFLMGVKMLPVIVRNLLKHGRDPDTPVALISRGTLPEQRVLTGFLGDIALRADMAANLGDALQSPATIVVGDTARLHEVLGRAAPDAFADFFDEELELIWRGDLRTSVHTP